MKKGFQIAINETIEKEKKEQEEMEANLRK